MATYTITVGADTTPPYTIDSQVVDNCYSRKIVTVKHSGTDKHVEIFATDSYGSPGLINEVITADKTYDLYLNGDTRNNQSVYSAVILNIRSLTATGTLLATIFVDRLHNGNYC